MVIFFWSLVLAEAGEKITAMEKTIKTKTAYGLNGTFFVKNMLYLFMARL